MRYDMGSDAKKYAWQLDLVAKSDLQIRDRAIESARQTTNRHLESKLGKKEFKFKVMMYPHHILRENPLASGAGADRMSTGMKHSFGKPIGVAARCRKGQTLFRLLVQKKHLEAGRDALKKAGYKVPCSVKMVVKSLEPKKAKPAAKPVKEEKPVEKPVEEAKEPVAEETPAAA